MADGHHFANNGNIAVYLGNGSTDSPIVTKFGTVTQNDPIYRIRIGR